MSTPDDPTGPDSPDSLGSDVHEGDTAIPAARQEPASRGGGQPRSRGLFSGGARTEGGSGSRAPKWLDSLSSTLTDLASDITSVTVRTYAADDLNTAVGDPRTLEEQAMLRAWTRIALDGDTDICVPTHGGKVDKALWELHLGVVQQAQKHRSEMVQTLIESVSSLWSIVR